MNQNTLLKKNDKEIIAILELPELYTDALVKNAEQELNRRNIPQEELQAIAEELFRKRCRELFEDRRFPVEDVFCFMILEKMCMFGNNTDEMYA